MMINVDTVHVKLNPANHPSQQRNSNRALSYNYPAHERLPEPFTGVQNTAILDHAVKFNRLTAIA